MVLTNYLKFQKFSKGEEEEECAVWLEGDENYI